MPDRPDTIDELTWAQLSPEDQAAVTEPDDPPAPPTAEAPAATEPPAPTEAPVAEAPAPTEAPAATEAPAPVAEAPPAATTAPQPAATPPAAPAPAEFDPYEPQALALPVDYNTEKTRIGAAITDLEKKFEDGEITTTEFVRQRDRVNAELVNLEQQKFRVDQRAEERQRYQIIKWTSTRQSFLDAAADVYPVGSEARQEFIAMTEELGNAPRFRSMTHAQFLAAIDKRVRPQYAPAAPAATPPAAPAPAKPTPARVPDLKSVPPTLSSVPAADITQAEGGEFAHIDKLTGLEYEQAIAALTPAQRARWERAA